MKVTLIAAFSHKRYLPLDEEHAPMPCETYGLSKALGEQVAEMFARSSPETSFVSLRFTNIVKRERWGVSSIISLLVFDELTNSRSILGAAWKGAEC